MIDKRPLKFYIVYIGVEVILMTAWHYMTKILYMEANINFLIITVGWMAKG